jgi:hypothetical protein
VGVFSTHQAAARRLRAEPLRLDAPNAAPSENCQTQLLQLLFCFLKEHFFRRISSVPVNEPSFVGLLCVVLVVGCIEVLELGHTG